jgi:hypothetical protein
VGDAEIRRGGLPARGDGDQVDLFRLFDRSVARITFYMRGEVLIPIFLGSNVAKSDKANSYPRMDAAEQVYDRRKLINENSPDIP